jgi:hypothetical protein
VIGKVCNIFGDDVPYIPLPRNIGGLVKAIALILLVYWWLCFTELRTASDGLSLLHTDKK